jgi:hypothetical protein
MINNFLLNLHLKNVFYKFSSIIRWYLHLFKSLEPKSNKIFLTKINYQDTLTTNFNRLSHNFNRNKPSNLNNKPLKSLNLLTLYLSLLNIVSDTTLEINGSYRSFFIFEFSKNYPPYINISKVLLKWKNSYNFLYNIFFQNIIVLTFSSKVLKKEVNAFNWSIFSFDYNLFKLVSPFFTIKNLDYGEPSLSLRKMFRTQKINNSIIIDMPYHYRTVQLLRSSDIYTIALTPFNINPWTINYPIPCSSSNLFTQYLFLRLITFIRRKAISDYYRLQLNIF